jgi:hypothetical protein
MRGLEIFVVYRSPADYPGAWIVRRSTVTETGAMIWDASPFSVRGTLFGAREAIPPGLVRLDRDPSDPPVIWEIWL